MKRTDVVGGSAENIKNALALLSHILKYFLIGLAYLHPLEGPQKTAAFGSRGSQLSIESTLHANL